MRVPAIESLSVGQNVLPTPSFRSAQFDPMQTRRLRPVAAPEARGINTPDIAGKDMQRLGEAQQRMGETLTQVQIAEAKIRQEAENEVSRVRIDAAVNRAKEVALRLTYDEGGYSKQKGFDALNRPDGKSLDDEYGELYQKELDSIAEGLGTPEQKAAFSQRAAELSLSLRANIAQHRSREYERYALSEAEGAQAIAMREIALGYGDVKTIDSAVDRIKEQTFRKAKIQGLSADWQEAESRRLASAAHKIAITAALDAGDVDLAKGYLSRYKDTMQGDDIVDADRKITAESKVRAGLEVAVEYVNKAIPLLDPGPTDRAFSVMGVDMGRAFGALIQAESGGRQFAKDGKPLTSSAGAIGVAQVMPKTGPEAAKLAGLPWDETRYRTDEKYNKALGLAYFQKQLQTFGSLPEAYAAYNAGPGALQNAKTRERKEGGRWLDYLPKETRDYVAKNMKMYEGGSTQRPPSKVEVYESMLADPRIANDPKAQEVARVELDRRFRMMDAAKKQREEETFSQAMNFVIQSGGDFNAMPSALRNQIPADDYGKVLDFAEKLSKGKKPQTNFERYYDLMATAASDPESFKRLNLMKYAPELSEEHLAKFINMQTRPEELRDLSTLEGQKRDMVDSLKLNKRQAGVFSMEADKAIEEETRSKGKTLNQAERQAILDRLVIKGKGFGAGYAFEARAEGESFVPKFSATDERKARQSLARMGVSNPTPDQLRKAIEAAYGITPAPRGATGSF